jgi:hypothetical protein
MNNEFLKMQKLAGLITEGQYKAKLNENYDLQPIKSILSLDLSSKEKMDQIGDFMTDTEEGQDLSNTNLGDPVDGWFSTKRDADKWLDQIQYLINNPEEIEDFSDDLE